jgi:glycogen debranching enzyme
MNDPRLEQIPSPGEHFVLHQGTVFTVELRSAWPGRRAYLRTNLGHASVRWREVLAFAEEGRAVLHRDWSDLPMRELSPGCYCIDLPLVETGVFEAKAFLLTDGEDSAQWVPGENLRLKVESAESYCSNTIYSAFPRQFGHAPTAAGDLQQAQHQLDAAGYHVIPPSGTFRDVIRKLDEIAALRVRILQLLPVHPVPTTFARMGRFGSPFATGDYYTVDPAMAEFDKHTTPMGQFRELVDAAHARGMRVFLDMPANHTGWASALQNHHPEWFQHTDDGDFVQPGAWGVVWEDLVALDYSHHSLWRYMGEVFLHWCRLGVDGFRCDAGYMLPVGAWQYILAKVRCEYPDATFLLEGLGGPQATTETLLGEIGLDWAYSELFQNHGREAIVHYMAKAWDVSRTFGTLAQFAETHDNDRLAAQSPTYAKMRTALCALFADHGTFGITNGVEWFATEKVDVHGASDLNWGSAENQCDHLRRLHAILETQPCFQPGASCRFLHTDDGEALVLCRHAANGDVTLVLVNQDCENECRAEWHDLGCEAVDVWHDLLGGDRWEPARRGPVCSLDLAPGQALCLASRAEALAEVDAVVTAPAHEPAAVTAQRLRLQVLAARVARSGYGDLADVEVEEDMALFSQDPRAFARSLWPGDGYLPVVEWQLGRDERRQVMVPPGHLLILRSADPFAAWFRQEGRVRADCRGIPLATAGWAAVLIPRGAPGNAELVVESYHRREARRVRGALLLLPESSDAALPLTAVGVKQLADVSRPHAVMANARGGMAQVRAAWGELASKYDAFLAANLGVPYPVDRTVLVSRFRGWVVCRDYSSGLGPECQTDFAVDGDGRAVWTFAVPTGMGRQVGLRLVLEMSRVADEVWLRVQRTRGIADALAADRPVRVILRPDVEWRVNHEVTKAYKGPETEFPAAVASHDDGFAFAPHGGEALQVRTSRGRFTTEPEWVYAVELPVDAERGMGETTDVFSPGHFSFELRADEEAVLLCRTGAEFPGAPGEDGPTESQPAGLDTVLRRSLGQFLVQREDSRTIIAGYPWFLDWGRDTLICLRGVIAAGELAAATDILLQFARFEDRGTLPNMIRGDDQSNRDTSDAPLWFLVATRDLVAASPNAEKVLGLPCGERSLREVSLSIGRHYLSGTPNGIHVDEESGLVFSPSHYTWMDTNHPAGTPREGYPIEIQALWHAGLLFLAETDPDGPWRTWAETVQESVTRLYVQDGVPGLCDCLHASSHMPAAQAAPDDAVRPNQLFAVTLSGLVQGQVARDVVLACEELLTPCGLRSLADRPLRHPLPVRLDGRALNDPHHPYSPVYAGDEDTRRKPAYHNGTSWSWPFPSYCEALVQAWGPSALAAAQAILGSCMVELRRGCLGHIAEIYDGDHPHLPKGCGAQAWGVSEIIRVEKNLRTIEVGPETA